MSFKNYLLGKYPSETGNHLDNHDYIQLIGMEFRVSMGVFNNIGIDFVAQRSGKTMYFRVGYLRDETKTISNVHPFWDCNGRIARIMMNAELFRGDQSRIIVPTVYREDYLLALRKVSRTKDPDGYIRLMEKLN